MQADLVVMGKIIGGGLPAAAVGGRAELMRMLAPGGRGLPGGNAVGQPAGGGRRAGDPRAARRRPRTGALAAITERLADGLREAAGGGRASGPGRDRIPGLLTVFFSERPVADFADGAGNATCDAYAAWCRALLARGVYPPPSQFEAWFPSLAHGRGAASSARSRPPPPLSPRSDERRRLSARRHDRRGRPAARRGSGRRGPLLGDGPPAAASTGSAGRGRSRRLPVRRSRRSMRATCCTTAVAGSW